MSRPFLTHFEETIEQIELTGAYDAARQVFVETSPCVPVMHTSTETGTGGHNDTDSDTDR